MGPERNIIATLCIVLGLLYLGMPRILLRWRSWWTKKTIGAEFVPSQRTERIYRIFGAIALLFGIALFARLL